MLNPNLKTKLYLLFLAPLGTSALANGFMLFLADQPILMICNFLIFGLLFATSRFFVINCSGRLLKMFNSVLVNVETVSYSANLLNEEIGKSIDEEGSLEAISSDVANLYLSLKTLEKQGEAQKIIYDKLKALLLLSSQRAAQNGPMAKEYLDLAKELGKLCSEAGQVSLVLTENLTHAQGRASALNDKMLLEKAKLTDVERALLISENLVSMSKRMGPELQYVGGILAAHAPKTKQRSRRVRLFSKATA